MSTDPLRERFDAFDCDNNGKIDESEFERLLDALGFGYSPAQARAAFSAIDRDGNGQIDFSEFLAWWSG
jgi:calmodulin